MDTKLRRDFDEIAIALESQGESTLAGMIDLCASEVESRTARVQRRPKPHKPQVTAAAAGGKSLIAMVRTARAECRALYREFKKAGSAAEARQLLRMAEELAQDEEELLLQAPDGTEVEIDLDAPVALEDGDFAEGEDEYSVTQDDEVPAEDDVECECVCPGDEESTETDTIELSDPEPVVEDEDLYSVDIDLPPAGDLDDVEACVAELRAFSRAARKAGHTKLAGSLLRQAMDTEEIFAEEVTVEEPVIDDVVMDPSPANGVEPVELPEPDGESQVDDASAYDYGDDDILDFSLEVEHEALDDNGASDDDPDFEPVVEDDTVVDEGTDYVPAEEPTVDEVTDEAEEDIADADPDASSEDDDVTLEAMYSATLKTLENARTNCKNMGLDGEAKKIAGTIMIYKQRLASLRKNSK